MKNITVAIPYYNSFSYIEDAIRIPLLDNRVDEILICDDHSDDSQYYDLLVKVGQLNNGVEISYDINASLMNENHGTCQSVVHSLTSVNVGKQAKKIEVIRNDTNIGGFRNKYHVVSQAKNEWVYLLDSDNFLVECSIPSLYNLPEWDEKICYCPSVPIMQRKDSWRAWDDWNHRRFGYKPFDLKGVQNFFRVEEKYSKNMGCGLGVNGFLNTGNFFVNRDRYVNSLKDAFEDPNVEPHAADVVAFSYYWLVAGGMLQIVPDLYYFHRIRDDSFWQRTGMQAGAASQMYEEMIKNANA